jgi:hypothetical protein
MSYMTTVATATRAPAQAPRLRLLPTGGGAGGHPHAVGAEVAETSSTLRLFSRPSASEQPVLIAGSDPAAREALRSDLARSMSPDTVIQQARAVWEVLARAGDSSVVILSGELEELSGEHLMQMLAHRHPGLPVVNLDDRSAPLERARVAC